MLLPRGKAHNQSMRAVLGRWRPWRHESKPKASSRTYFYMVTYVRPRFWLKTSGISPAQYDPHPLIMTKVNRHDTDIANYRIWSRKFPFTNNSRLAQLIQIHNFRGFQARQICIFYTFRFDYSSYKHGIPQSHTNPICIFSEDLNK